MVLPTMMVRVAGSWIGQAKRVGYSETNRINTFVIELYQTGVFDIGIGDA